MMLIVQVNVHVKDDQVERFIMATEENVKNSILEQGIARFDFFQNMEDPSRFILIEAYRNEDAPAKHKETEHYKKWKAAVESMMSEPRFSIKYANILPSDMEL
jgi:(4S)-4-hydroxy-5-phosphonooxypentane-2,3-dione isomerase